MKKVLKRIVTGVICVAITLTSGIRGAYAETDIEWTANFSREVWNEIQNERLLGASFFGYSNEELEKIKEVTLGIVGNETDPKKQLNSLKNWFVRYNNYDGNFEKHKAELKEIFAPHTMIVSRWLCAEQTELFVEMCRVIGIKANSISGFAYQEDLRINENADYGPHGWAIVYIDNEWKFVDPSWLRTDNSYYLMNIEDTFYIRMWKQISNSKIMGSKQYWCSDYAKEGIVEAYEKYLIPTMAYLETKHIEVEEVNGWRYTFATEAKRELFAEYAIQLYTQVNDISHAELTNQYESEFTDFSDVNESDHPEIGIASALGIVNGVGDNKFNPNGNITRQEAATMLMRLGKLLGVEATDEVVKFNDVSDNSWAKEGIDYVSSLGIMNGVGNDNFDPNGLYTHEQTILTMVRLFDMI